MGQYLLESLYSQHDALTSILAKSPCFQAFLRYTNAIEVTDAMIEVYEGIMQRAGPRVITLLLLAYLPVLDAGRKIRNAPVSPECPRPEAHDKY
jgi:hypothetical protein